MTESEQLADMKDAAEAVRVVRMTIETEDGERIELSNLVVGGASYVPTNKGGYVFCNCVFQDTVLSWSPLPKST